MYVECYEMKCRPLHPMTCNSSIAAPDTANGGDVIDRLHMIRIMYSTEMLVPLPVCARVRVSAFSTDMKNQAQIFTKLN